MRSASLNQPGNLAVRHAAKSRRGFTLLECLAVIGILLLLVVLLLPAVRSSGPAALRAQCTHNLKAIAIAIQQYTEAHKALPPAYTVDAQGRPLHSWRTLILPYLEETPLYNKIDLAKPWNDPVNAVYLRDMPEAYRCLVSNPPNDATTYLAIVGPHRCLAPDTPRPLAEITDPTASTLMVVEAVDNAAVPWMAPNDTDGSFLMSLNATTKFPHPNQTTAVFLDGHYTFLGPETTSATIRANLSIDGGDDPKSSP